MNTHQIIFLIGTDDITKKIVSARIKKSNYVLTSINSLEQLPEQEKSFKLIINLSAVQNGEELAKKIRDINNPVLFIGDENSISRFKDLELSSPNIDFVFSPLNESEFKLRLEKLLFNRVDSLEFEDKSEQAYRTLFEQGTDPILLIEDGIFVECNNAACSFLKVDSNKSIIGKTPQELSPIYQPDGQKSSEKASNIIENALVTGHARFEWVHTAATGEELWVDVALTKIKIDGKVKIYTLWRDISESKRNEIALRKSEERFRAFMDHIPAGIFIKDFEGKYVFINKFNEENFSVIDWRGKTAADFFETQVNEKFSKEENEAIKNGSYLGYTYVKDRDGHDRYFNTQYFTIESDTGEKLIAGVSLDETEAKLAELKLEESEEKYKSIFENSALGIFRSSPEGELLEANDSFARILGYSNREELFESIEKVHTLYQHPFARRELLVEFERNGFVEDYEVRLKTKNGSLVWIQMNASAHLDPIGEVYYEGTISNITERKIAEQKLHESEERFELAMQASQDGIFDWDLETNQIYFSPGWKKMLGYEYDELPNDFSIWEKLTEPEDVKRSWEMQQELINKKRDRFVMEFKMRHKDGSWREILSRADAVFNSKGKAVRIVGTHTDITQRKVYEKELESKSQELSSLLEISQLLTENLALDSVLNIIVEKSVKLKGLDSGALYLVDGDNLYLEVTYPALPPNFPEEFRHAKLSNHPHIKNCVMSLEVNHISDTNNAELTKEEKLICDSRNLSSILYLPMVAKGKVIGVLILGTIGRQFDFNNENLEPYKIFANICESSLENIRLFRELKEEISERKLAQDSLKESEERYRILIENAPDAIAIHSDGKIVYANPASAKLLEANDISELIGQDITQIVHPESLPGTIERVKNILTGNKKYNLIEEKYITLKGKEIPVEVTAVAIQFNNKPSIQVIIRDISERKQAEDALRKSEEKYRMLVENQTDLLVRVNPKGEFEYVSPTYCKVFGFTEKEILGKRFLPLVHEDDKAKTEAMVKKLFEPPYKVTFEQRAMTKKGWRWFAWSDKGVLDQNGNVTSIIGVGRDITERKEVELEVLKERNRAEKYLEISAIMMIALNKKGEITMINSRGADLLGYSKNYILGKNLIDSFMLPENRTEMKRSFKDIVSGKIELPEYTESDVLCRYNKIKTLAWYNNLIKNDDGEIIGMLSSAEDITKELELQKELEETNTELIYLTDHIQKMREEERSKLAREIHDDLGQSLTALKLDLSFLNNEVKTQDSKIGKRIKSALAVTNQTIKAVQDITSELRPGLIDDLGLIPTIEWYVNEFRERTNINLKLSIQIEEEDIKEKNKITIYRILQESLTNIARHTKATEIKVKLVKNENAISLSVADNGKGISEADLENPKSFGLMGMKERANSIDGEVLINSKPGKGTVVKLLIPLGNE